MAYKKKILIISVSIIIFIIIIIMFIDIPGQYELPSNVKEAKEMNTFVFELKPDPNYFIINNDTFHLEQVFIVNSAFSTWYRYSKDINKNSYILMIKIEENKFYEDYNDKYNLFITTEKDTLGISGLLYSGDEILNQNYVKNKFINKLKEYKFINLELEDIKNGNTFKFKLKVID